MDTHVPNYLYLYSKCFQQSYVTPTISVVMRFHNLSMM